ncbi:MAG: tetratricopeptide repeat protein [Bdellovibrionales bacterium]
MNSITTFLACLIGFCAQPAEPQSPQGLIGVSYTINQGGRLTEMRAINAPMIRETLSGNYLAARFAQRHHDWELATNYMEEVAKKRPDDLSLRKRTMVLAMGAGDYDIATREAAEVLKAEPDNALALLFTSVKQFKDQDYTAAVRSIQAMPPGSLSEFIMPLLHSWAEASQGVEDTAALRGSVIHIYHAILIADFLGAHEQVTALLDRALSSPNMTTHDLERIADLYGHIKNKDKALDLYEQVAKLDPDNNTVPAKIERLKNDENAAIFKRIETPEDGIAEAMFDMARVLYGDYSDESARIFANMALYLDPDKEDAKLLMAYISARNERYDDAIAYYQSIGPEDKHYFDARRRAADLLEENGRTQEALDMLKELVATHDDLDALIQIGDLYRRSEDFGKAITVYNQAQDKLGGDIPADYWQLYYVRGISYEQDGQWDKAEADLKAALAFEPDHPLVLNYLGYSWADQGVNLKQSLAMIKKAVSLRPDDGYIADSLGWVLYKSGKYKEAVPNLERAVELLPYDPVINDHLGDAYWRVGRVIEARFQWQRARNHSEDESLITAVDAKLDQGLAASLPVTKQAKALMDNEIKEILE